MKKYYLAAAIGLVTLLTGCNEGDVAFEDLQKTWTLTSIDGKDVDSTADFLVQTKRKDGPEELRISGNLGCNNFFGLAELDDNKFKVDKMGSTRKMCPPELSSIEKSLSSVLSDWSDISIEENLLTLSNGKNTLVYKLK